MVSLKQSMWACAMWIFMYPRMPWFGTNSSEWSHFVNFKFGGKVSINLLSDQWCWYFINKLGLESWKQTEHMRNLMWNPAGESLTRHGERGAFIFLRNFDWRDVAPWVLWETGPAPTQDRANGAVYRQVAWRTSVSTHGHPSMTQWDLQGGQWFPA